MCQGFSFLFEYITNTNESESIKSESERSCTGKHKGHSKLGVKCCHRSLKFLHSFLHINSVLLCQYSILVVTVVWCLVGAEYLTFTEPSTNLLDWIVSVQTQHFIVSLFLSWPCAPKTLWITNLIFCCRPEGFGFAACGWVISSGWLQSAFALDLAMHNVRIHLHYYVQLDKVKGNSQWSSKRHFSHYFRRTMQVTLPNPLTTANSGRVDLQHGLWWLPDLKLDPLQQQCPPSVSH